MAATTSNLLLTLHKLQSDDNDLIYMAVRDLRSELQHIRVHLDQTLQTKLLNAIQRHLVTHGTNDVNEQILLTLPLLINLSATVQPVQTLVNNVLVKATWVEPKEGSVEAAELHPEDREEAVTARTRACNALTTILTQCQRIEFLLPLASRVLPVCMTLLSQHSDNTLLVTEILGVVASIVKVQAQNLTPIHSQLLDSFLSLTFNGNRLIVNNAIQALAALAPHLEPTLYTTLLAQIVDLNAYRQRSVNREYPSLLAIAAIAKSTPQRIQTQTSQLITLLSQYIDSLSSDADSNAELRENALIALDEVLNSSRANTIAANVEALLQSLQSALSYDPNLVEADTSTDNVMETSRKVPAAADEDDEFGGDDDEFAGADAGDMDDEFGDYAGGSDNEADGGEIIEDDISWRIRRAAAKCVAAIANSCQSSIGTTHINTGSALSSELLIPTTAQEQYLQVHASQQILQQLVPVVISRLQERVDSVRAEVLQTFVNILRLHQQACLPIPAAILTTVPILLPLLPVRDKATSMQLEASAAASTALQHIFTTYIPPNRLQHLCETGITSIVEALASTPSAQSATQLQLLTLLDGIGTVTAPETLQKHAQTVVTALQSLVQSSPTTASQALIVLRQLVYALTQAPLAEQQFTTLQAFNRQEVLPITHLDVLCGVYRHNELTNPPQRALSEALTRSISERLLDVLEDSNSDRTIKSEAVYTLSTVFVDHRSTLDPVMRRLTDNLRKAMLIEGTRAAALAAISRLVRTNCLQFEQLSQLLPDVISYVRQNNHQVQRAALAATNASALRLRQYTGNESHAATCRQQLLAGMSWEQTTSAADMDESNHALRDVMIANILLVTREVSAHINISGFLNQQIKSLLSKPTVSAARLTTVAQLFQSAKASQTIDTSVIIAKLSQVAASHKTLATELICRLLLGGTLYATIVIADVGAPVHVEIHEEQVNALKARLAPYVADASSSDDTKASLAIPVLDQVIRATGGSAIVDELQATITELWQSTLTSSSTTPVGSRQAAVAQLYATLVMFRPSTLLPSLAEQCNTALGLQALHSIAQRLTSSHIGSEPQMPNALTGSNQQYTALIQLLQKHTAEIIKAISVTPPVDRSTQIALYSFLVIHFPLIVFTYFQQLNEYLLSGIISGLTTIQALPKGAQSRYQQFAASLQQALPTIVQSVSSSQPSEQTDAAVKVLEHVAKQQAQLYDTATAIAALSSLISLCGTSAQQNGHAASAKDVDQSTVMSALAAVVSIPAFAAATPDAAAVTQLLAATASAGVSSRSAAHGLLEAILRSTTLTSAEANAGVQQHLPAVMTAVQSDIHRGSNNTASSDTYGSEADTTQTALRVAQILVQNKQLLPVSVLSSAAYTALENDGNVKSRLLSNQSGIVA